MNRIQLQEKLLQETKYSKWYLNIIETANSQNRAKLKKVNKDYIYYENHHILPESLFVEYSNLKENKWNSVLLTAKEHFICHRLIHIHYRKLEYVYGERKMSKTISYMSRRSIYNAKHYESIKLNLSCSEETKEKMKISAKNRPRPSKETIEKRLYSNRDYKHSDETKNKISKSKAGQPSWNKGLKCKPLSEEHKRKISIGNKGKIISEEQKAIIRESNRTRIITDETRTKMSISAKKRGTWNKGKKSRTIICPKCEKEGGVSAMKRWHGLNGEKCNLEN